MEIEINTYEQYQDEIQTGTVLVDFYATWCGPCRMIAPFVEQIAEEHPEIKVLRVDVDKVPEAAALYGIASIPTLVKIINGAADPNLLIGYRPKQGIEKFMGF